MDSGITTVWLMFVVHLGAVEMMGEASTFFKSIMSCVCSVSGWVLLGQKAVGSERAKLL